MKLKYVTKFRDRHGAWWHYFRYRGQKFKLPGKPGSAEYLAAYARYLADSASGALGRNNVVFINGTISWVIEKYLVHELGMRQHKEATRRAYRLYCDIVKREVGQFKISDLTPQGVRALRNAVVEKHKASVADMCVTMISALWKFAIDQLNLPLGHNPGHGITKLHRQKRLTKRWSPDLIERFNAAATPIARLGLALLLHTAQRESDVVKMRWTDIDWKHAKGPRLHIKQRKTGEPVWIPIADPAFRSLLEATPRINDFILNSERNQPFTDAKGLSTVIRRTLKTIGVEGHSGHGLRVSPLQSQGGRLRRQRSRGDHRTHRLGDVAKIFARGRPPRPSPRSYVEVSRGGKALIDVFNTAKCQTPEQTRAKPGQTPLITKDMSLKPH
jgi:integrase